MLAEILKEKRNELGLTQQQIAEQLNVTRQTVSSWEVGKSIPDISSLIDISKLFNISLDYMLKGDVEVSDKIKEDALELNFLRFFSKSSLIIIAILLIILIPFSAVLIAAILLYFIIFKKKKIEIITYTKDVVPMKKNSNYLLQALTDAFSVIGGVTLFYIIVSFFTENQLFFIETKQKLFLLIFFFSMTLGRYLRYKKDNSK